MLRCSSLRHNDLRECLRATDHRAQIVLPFFIFTINESLVISQRFAFGNGRAAVVLERIVVVKKELGDSSIVGIALLIAELTH